MMSDFSIDTLERVVRTVVQAALAAVLALWVSAGSFDKIDWSACWQVALYAGGLALLTALAAKPVGDPDSASFLDDRP
jgi:hypothetical protein